MKIPRNESVGVGWVKCTLSVVWVVAVEGEAVLPWGLSGGLVAEKLSKVPIARGPTSLDQCTHLPRRGEHIEKRRSSRMRSFVQPETGVLGSSRNHVGTHIRVCIGCFNKLRTSRTMVREVPALADLLQSPLAVLKPVSKERGFGHRTGRRTRSWRTEA